jgi:hypothetical protein
VSGMAGRPRQQYHRLVSYNVPASNGLPQGLDRPCTGWCSPQGMSLNKPSRRVVRLDPYLLTPNTRSESRTSFSIPDMIEGSRFGLLD